VAVVAGGLRLRLRRGKTAPAGQGAEVGLPRGRHAETCPVRAFEEWQVVARRKAGPLFRQVGASGGIGAAALHPDAVRWHGGRGSDPGYTRNVESLGWGGAGHFRCNP
jgi:hypothetical protein